MVKRGAKILVYGYGNPGRGDDGLGPACAEAVEQLELPGVETNSNYQLALEDAALIADCELVVFIDASMDGAPPWTLRAIEARGSASFSTHILSPEQLLAITRGVFGSSPEAYLMGIRGFEFDGYTEGLSPAAGWHLRDAVSFLGDVLQPEARQHMDDWALALR